MTVEFLDILKARAEGPERLNEASLGRAYQHYLKTDTSSFAILTSWRQALPKKQNETNFKALQQQLRGAQLGFFKMLGHWREEGQETATAEPSLFVPGISKDLATRLGHEYDQDAVIYAGADTNSDVILILRNGSEKNIGEFHPNKIAQAYSSVKGKTFAFEGFEYPAQSFMEKTIELRFLTGID